MFTTIFTYLPLVMSVAYPLDLLFRAVVKLTASKNDDALVAKVEAILAGLGVDVTKPKV